MRDASILELMLFLGLRRSEIATLDLCHLEKDRLLVKTKGLRQRQALTLPDQTSRTLRRWLAVRGITPGPLFLALNHGLNKTRLTHNGVYEVVRTRGREAGLEIHPHQIRRAAITEALRICARDGRDIGDAQVFSRHSDVRTTLSYKNQVGNPQGEISSMLAQGGKSAGNTAISK